MRNYIRGSILALGLLFGCSEEEITSLLELYIADAPIDAENVKGVQVVIANVEWQKDGEWRDIRYFEKPVSVDIFSYRDGRGFPLAVEYVSPGEYTSFRITFKVSKKKQSTNVNPLSNVMFANGDSKYLYWFNEEPTEVTIDAKVNIPPRDYVRLVMDFDLRKSIRINEAQEFILQPVISVVNLSTSGSIKGKFNNSSYNRIVVYAYKQGTFSTSEYDPAVSDTIPFLNSVTSNSLDELNNFFFPFLEAGNYDLIFIQHTQAGDVEQVLETSSSGIEVTAGERTEVSVDIDS